MTSLSTPPYIHPYIAMLTALNHCEQEGMLQQSVFVFHLLVIVCVLPKILLIGDSSVGKSSILRRQKFGTFDVNIESTIGVDVSEYIMWPC